MNRNKKRIVRGMLNICALAVTVSIASAAETAAEHWAQPTLESFREAGYLTVDGTEPDETMTAHEFVNMLNRVTGQSIACTDTTAFTRQKAVVLLAEQLNVKQADLSVLNRFSDEKKISADARQSVANMVAAGYINGTDLGEFLPDKQLTCAEAVTMLNNALGTLQSMRGGLVYGTATLTYADYYAGDVSSTDGYGVDGITSATVSKYSTLKNTYSDYTEEKTEGYHILGVLNVNVAVDAEDYETYMQINPTFRAFAVAPDQYKKVDVVNGQAVYAATTLNVVDTVTDATAVLTTGSTWGDYEIDVYEDSTSYLRNTRSDEGFAINSYIQGTIVETASGLKVGLEFLQSMWVQPYEISFNISHESAMNAHIVGWDNMSELSKLEGETIVRITYLMPTGTYVYEFDGIYIKPAYKGTNTATVTFTEGSAEVVLTGIPTDLNNVTVTITCGTGRTKETVANAVSVENGKLTMSSAYDSDQVYTVKISSSNYADLTVDNQSEVTAVQ